jgi:hypothetical protein
MWFLYHWTAPAGVPSPALRTDANSVSGSRVNVPADGLVSAAVTSSLIWVAFAAGAARTVAATSAAAARTGLSMVITSFRWACAQPAER